MLVLSLFPGIGLLDRAFEEEGFCIVRGPDVLWGGDVRRFHPSAGRFDGAIGGPPCQSFSSLANLVRAKGYEPKFGDLIPEYQRCVAEAQPAWFLMEEVPQAYAPTVPGYAVHSFTLCNSSLDSGDGLGQEQERLRLFAFGVRGPGPAPDLRAHIQLAALRLPKAGTVTTTHVNNSDEAKGRGQRCRTAAVTGADLGSEPRLRRQAAIDPRRVPVAIGGSGRLKPGARNVAVTAAHPGQNGRPKGGHQIVYAWQEMLRLQGLPPDFLEHAPFTAEGKKKAVANGVPLPMGRAIARAVKAALAARQEATA